MKWHIVMLGVLFCGAAMAVDNPSQGAPASQSTPAAPQSLTGCVDEQFGQYVLLDGEMVKIIGLQSAVPSNDVFAKYVGHVVQVKGSRSRGPKPTFTVTGIEKIADVCGQAREAK
jgi:hypothetical protein